MAHELIECGQGAKNLRKLIAEINQRPGWEIVAIVPDTGGFVMSMLASGASSGLLVVVKHP